MHDIAQKRKFLGEMQGLIKLVRPKQWVKNSFVFAPLIFAGEFLHPDSVYSTLLAAFLFCIAASAVYIVNDLKDIEKDRIHPEKCKKRPLASGQVSPQSAIILLILLYIVLISFWTVVPNVIYVIFIYLALNWAYTFKLKHEPVIEIFIVAFGFVLRVYAGAIALTVPVSHWMFITTLSISLYLASIKRRQELLQSGSQSRGVLAYYSVTLIDRFAEMSAVTAVVFYSLYAMEVQPKLVVTVPLVIFGLFRYWYIVETLKGGESPTDVIIQDKQILLTVLLWVGCCIWVLLPT
ncbi:decaprenyl-phosphate phosphoribosyltransferase [Acinetobacter ursingii]|uniref:decaprenyl-phosphate phosphoribosyltransferase n=1 Tax=Acinetobacter ursingii TaxID=108980 RepID=UPI002448E107|nr:decaprenyl-phosphate phosphoribosyltransferase [Acinetobacter ursingii]MDG9858801.1 decaprenyl-phosphate phosphoribosyltransferase [Acinetobacter ursingii]MDG9892508.1 decaprenyl-phosphate phosphoribosyltransferase [Acinetobacter ursingii]MDH0006221.1 decaprenyl-phosphate phosphoribosyltransferase [Acinetobacter ursingii]MDH0477759.1 decaprenyl-phosphate phosphoribosyltransferase [Acinetobacter ursingii]MDH2118598.1 decaprenyl-phosphate phosphoribosyltransferase [Acinetobacter ursingii]